MSGDYEPTRRQGTPEETAKTEFVHEATLPYQHDDPNSNPTLSGQKMDPDAERKVLEELGRFREIEFLAEGGMGQVYTAIDPNIDRRVAIKILHPDLAAHQMPLAKFENEFRLTGQLEHPNIVPIYESGRTEDGQIYFCMKFVQGESLAQRLTQDRAHAVQKGNPLDPTPYLHHLLRVCDALSFAHSRKIVHRDLKPANLMVGQFGEVLVMDWGLAREIREAIPTSTTSSSTSPQKTTIDPLHTLEGQVVGTPSYMAPEQARGEVHQIDQQTDVYALGAILYDLVTGTPPYTETNYRKVIEQVRHGSFARPRERAPEASIPAELEALILKAMATDIRDRYPDVASLQADIQAYLHGKTLQAATYNPLQRLSKWMLHHRKVLTAVSVVVLLSAGLFGALTWNRHRSRIARYESALREASDRRESAGDITKLREARASVDPKTKGERRDLPKERIARKKAIEAYLTAAGMLDRALQIRPEDPVATQRRQEVGRAIGEMALQGGDYLLARQAFLQLESHGISEDEVQDLVEDVETAEQSVPEWRRKRIESILQDLTDGLSRADRPKHAPLVPDFVLEVSAYRDLQTVEILGNNLQELVAKARATPPPISWTQSDRDRATFICRVLDQLGFPEGVKPLAEWMGVVRDHDLAVLAGWALCKTRHADAQAPLMATRTRLGILSDTWKQIQPFLHLLPASRSPKLLTTAKQFYQQGELYAAKNNQLKAIESYTRAIELQPKHARAYTNRGVCFMQLKDTKKAFADYEKAIQLNPRLPEAHHNRGTIHMRNHRWDLALVDFTKAIELDPKFPNPYVSRARVERERGDLDAAIADCTQAIKLDPLLYIAFSERGAAYKDKRLFNDALADFNHCILINPKSAYAHFSRGSIYFEQKKPDAAISEFTKTIEINPRFGKAYHNRGWALERKGDLGGAMIDYNQAIEIDPNSSPSYYNRGRLRQKRGDPQGAIEDYTRAIETNPQDIKAYLNRGNVHRAEGNLRASASDYGRAIQIDPTFTKAYFNRGLIRQKSGNPDGAIEDYTKAIELNPRYAEAYTNRGTLRRDQRNLRAAISDFEKALEVAPSNWSYRKMVELHLAQARKMLQQK